MTPDKTIDCTGLFCPMPIANAKIEIDQMKPGEVLEIVREPVRLIRQRRFLDDLGVLRKLFDDGLFFRKIKERHVHCVLLRHPDVPSLGFAKEARDQGVRVLHIVNRVFPGLFFRHIEVEIQMAV